MTFEKHLRSVSRVASQRLGILRKSWRVFHDRSLLGDAFGVLSWEFWSTVLQWVLGYWYTPFFNWGVLECDIAHRRSVVVQCMLYKIRCNPMHPLYMVLYQCRMWKCGLYAVLWWHIFILMRLPAAEPRTTTEPWFSFQCPRWTILLTPYSMVWDWRASIAGPMLFHWH